MKVLLFIGAGASVELGVPAMRRMAEQFRDHLHDLALPPDVIDKIDTLVGDSSKDMEHAIDVIDRREGGYQAQIELGEGPDESQILPYRTIRQEAEWFVQHCCEQISTDSAITMWSPTLRAAMGAELAIASTNYDRAIEIAAARLSIELEDGFEDFESNEFARWRGHQNNENTVLYKLHGSTDWYRAEDGTVVKLRHPMPLFGKLKILPEPPAGKTLQSALVLPSREKLVTLSPFQAIAAEFRQKANAADVVVFLGSSLRDPHMRDVCVSCSASKPTYVVSRSGNFPTDVLPEGAKVLRQGAGRFLISTFAKFLRDADESVLDAASDSDAPDSGDVLDQLVAARDENLEPRLRCRALENLADAHVQLHLHEAESLLKSPDDDVATFALGLVPTSFDKDALIQAAAELAEQRPGSKFRNELDTLLQLLRPSPAE